MAYEKQVWQCGDTITADKMNHIEEGIENASQGGGGVFTITFSTTSRPSSSDGRNVVNMENLTADKTFNELLEAYQQGIPIYAFSAGLSRVGGTVMKINQLLVSYVPSAQGFIFSRSDVDFTANSVSEVGTEIRYSSDMLTGNFSSYIATEEQ